MQQTNQLGHLPTEQIPPAGAHDVVAHAHNGLVAVEAWRQSAADRIDQAWAPRLQRALDREQQTKELAAQNQRIQNLRLGTLAEDPAVAARYRKELDTELVGYHRGRAQQLGAHVTAMEVAKPRFASARTWIAEKRISHHETRARKAAGRLIRAA